MSETLVEAVEIARLSTLDTDFEARLEALLAWEGVSDAELQRRVDDIIAGVRARGDAALIDYSQRFDRLSVRAWPS
jgi:histidinol dehydrogenase